MMQHIPEPLFTTVPALLPELLAEPPLTLPVLPVLAFPPLRGDRATRSATSKGRATTVVAEMARRTKAKKEERMMSGEGK